MILGHCAGHFHFASSEWNEVLKKNLLNFEYDWLGRWEYVIWGFSPEKSKKAFLNFKIDISHNKDWLT